MGSVFSSRPSLFLSSRPSFFLSSSSCVFFSLDLVGIESFAFNAVDYFLKIELNDCLINFDKENWEIEDMTLILCLLHSEIDLQPQKLQRENKS